MNRLQQLVAVAGLLLFTAQLGVALVPFDTVVVSEAPAEAPPWWDADAVAPTRECGVPLYNATTSSPCNNEAQRRVARAGAIAFLVGVATVGSVLILGDGRGRGSQNPPEASQARGEGQGR